MFLSISQATHYTENDVQSILEKYDRTPIIVMEDIDIINKWFITQHHLPIKPSKRQILSFLIMNKFSIERTKQKLDFNYTIRNLMPEIFENMLPTNEELVKTREIVTIVPLPKLHNLNRIMYLGLEIPNPKYFNVSAMLTYFCQTMEVRTLYDFSLSNDYIVNFCNVELRLISKIGLMDIKKYTIILEKVYSARIASIHLINVPSYAQGIIELVNSFLPKKIRSRTKVLRNVQELLNYFPEEYLPKELGFENGCCVKTIKENWTNLLLENSPYLELVQNTKVDETLRSEKLINDDLLGYHGNFKKLAVD